MVTLLDALPAFVEGLRLKDVVRAVTFDVPPPMTTLNCAPSAAFYTETFPPAHTLWTTPGLGLCANGGYGARVTWWLNTVVRAKGLKASMDDNDAFDLVARRGSTSPWVTVWHIPTSQGGGMMTRIADTSIQTPCIDAISVVQTQGDGSTTIGPISGDVTPCSVTPSAALSRTDTEVLSATTTARISDTQSSSALPSASASVSTSATQLGLVTASGSVTTNSRTQAGTDSNTTSSTRTLPVWMPKQDVEESPLGAEGANGVMAVQCVAVAVSAALSPVVASQSLRTSLLTKALHCGEGAQTMSYWEVPIQVQLLPTTMSLHTNSVVLTSFSTVFLPFVILTVLHWRSSSWMRSSIKHAALPHPLLCRSIACAVALLGGWFIPSISQWCLYVIVRSTDSVNLSAASVVLGVHVFVLLAVMYYTACCFLERVKILAGDAALGQRDQFVSAEGGSFMSTFAVFVEGVARHERPLSRLYFFEDVLCSSVIASINGIQLPSACSTVCVLNLGIIAAHVAYLALVRPYRSKMETLCSAASAAVQLCVAVECVALRFVIKVDEDTQVASVGYTALLQTAVVVVQAAWTYLRILRKYQRQAFARKAAQRMARVGQSHNSELAVAMLTVPVENAAHQPLLNPLADDQPAVPMSL